LEAVPTESTNFWAPNLGDGSAIKYTLDQTNYTTLAKTHTRFVFLAPTSSRHMDGAFGMVFGVERFPVGGNERDTF
jgi:hypothetical protein